MENPSKLKGVFSPRDLKGILNSFTDVDEDSFISYFIGSDQKQLIDKYRKELLNDVAFFEHLRQTYADFYQKPLVTIQPWTNCLYIIVRILKPKKIVETGVWAGISTSFILRALERNKMGKLYSIDLPTYDFKTAEEQRMKAMPKKAIPGWIIPKYLKKRWKLLIGSSQQHLPKLLRELKGINMFIHDSLHTYDHMTFEFQKAWPFVSDDGFLLADNINWNNAFYDFAEKIKGSRIQKYNFGAIRKKTLKA